MRTYSISAVLLDLDDPTKMIAALKEPLLTASAEEQDGYVPNCLHLWALAHGDILVIPYGVADHRINFATASITAVLKAMKTSEHPTIRGKFSTAVSRI